MDNLPAQNLEAERAVLGSILIDNSTLLEIRDVLPLDALYDNYIKAL